MRKPIILATVGSLLLSGTALADGDHDPSLDQVISIPSFTLFNQDLSPSDITFLIDIEPNLNPVVGFTFEGTVSGMTPGTGGSWASDLQLQLVSADGTGFVAGGFGAAFPSDEDWDFDGSGSGSDGTYTSTHFVDLGLKGGEWDFTFINTGTGTFADDSFTWSNVTITLHKKAALPAPGALALLGIAGLAGVRRRRK